MSKKLSDMRGIEIEVGDKLAWAAVTGRSAYIRVGIVDSFSKSGYININVTETGDLGEFKNSSKARIIFSERALILEKNTSET